MGSQNWVETVVSPVGNVHGIVKLFVVYWVGVVLPKGPEFPRSLDQVPVDELQPGWFTVPETGCIEHLHFGRYADL